MVRKLFLESHRWLGLVIGLFFAFIMLTGIIAIVVEQTQERVALTAPFEQLTPEEIGSHLDILLADKPAEVNGTLFLPTEVRPAYRISETIPVEGSPRGQTIHHFYSPTTLEKVHSVNPADRSAFMDLVVDLHTSLIDDTDITDYIGYTGVVISLVALYLWWPFRRGFKWRNIFLPRTWRKEHMLQNHAAGGIVSVLFLVMIALTGAMMGTRGTVTDIAEGMENPEVAANYTAPTIAIDKETPWVSWKEIVGNAYRALPSGAELGTIAAERGTAALDLRFRGIAGDFSMFGQTHVFVNPYSGEVVQVFNIEEASWLRWLLGMTRSLHYGEAMPLWYVVTLVLGCAIATIIAFTGVFGFIRKLLKV